MTENQILSINLDDCASWAWDKADELNQNYIDAGGPGYSDWDMWELTDYYYNQCIQENQ